MAVNEDRLRQRAYEIWEQEGRPHGEDMKHWLRAFQEIAASTEADGQPVKKPGSKKAGEADAAPKVKAASKSEGGAQERSDGCSAADSTKIATGVTKH